MKPYTLLILGYLPEPPSWDGCRGVFQMLTHGTIEAFRTLPHVTLHTAHVLSHAKQPLPQADFVLVNAFCGEEPLAADLKALTGARKVCSWREIPTNPTHADYCFWLGSGELRLPCCKALMRNVPKVPGSILVDHTWWTQDHTAEIEGWLEGYDRGPVSRLVRHCTENHPVPSWMGQVAYAPYPEYLRRTETFERHIITHIEGYAFGMVDMVARGIQVLSPPKLLPAFQIVGLNLPVFETREQLRTLLEIPVGEEWNRKIDYCMDYAECAAVMDRHFQEWME